MEILGIHHVQLAMPSGEEEKAREFYCGILGIDEVVKPEHLRSRGGAWFESGELRVHLGVEDNFLPNQKAHPAFLVSNLNIFTQRCKEAGIAIVKDKPLQGYVRVYINDPFGNRIELMQAV